MELYVAAFGAWLVLSLRLRRERLVDVTPRGGLASGWRLRCRRHWRSVWGALWTRHLKCRPTAGGGGGLSTTLRHA